MTSPHKRYEIIGTIGTGATSRVDKARDSMIGRTVALKTFLRGFGSGDLQKQFLREAQIIGRLTHPYIVGLYDVGTDEEGIPYLVMEYVEGKTLEATLAAGALPLERTAVWAADLASALARAHQCKIIHGDVKPANVLITAEGQVKLGDFGIARFATQVSGAGTLLGTPAYLSPEQILGKTQDCRSDLFSLGIILYQMSTGVRPFDGTSVSAVCAQIVSAEPPPPSHYNPELPAEFDHVVMRCLAKNPANRYATAEALGASLYPFARSKPVDLRAPMISSWWKRPTEARDLRLAAAVFLGLLVLGAGASAVWRHGANRSGKDVSRNATPELPAGGSPAAPAANLVPQMDTDGVLINVSTATIGSADEHASSASGVSADAQSAAPGGEISSPPGGARPEASAAAAVAHLPARQATPALKSKPLETAAKPDKAAAVAPAANTAVAPAGSKAALHVDVLSSVTDEKLSVFSGEQLLLSTPLEAEHVGDTLRFDCPVPAGQHTFRVVLTRADDSVLLEKDNISQIRADGSNFLGIHISRHAKMLLKHETWLEVVWPSSLAPVVTAGTPSTAGALALR
ncbi:MAG: serine/threonine-protein kinase [Candidatus Acidiferrum sp.]